MARPMKSGLPYWPRDVGFLRDKKVKMMKAEFGIKGVYILECLLDAIYEEEGYFKRWDEDDCFLMSDGVGDGCSPTLIAEVVKGCVKRSFFDQRVFDVFGVLTSAGIQRRYILGASKRDRIPLIEEYWLLQEEEIPAGVLLKCRFFSLSGSETAVSGEKTRVSVEKMTQREEKKRKVEQSKAKKHDQPPDGGRPLSEKSVEAGAALAAFRALVGRSAGIGEEAELLVYLSDMGQASVLEGFRLAQIRGVRTWPYVKGILNPWRQSQICPPVQRNGTGQTAQRSGPHALPRPGLDTRQVQKNLQRLDALLENGAVPALPADRAEGTNT